MTAVPTAEARAPALSLADLEAFDAHPSGGGRERRFCCPLPACRDKPRDKAHQSLGVNTETGGWVCFRCGGKGKLVERWRPAREYRRAAGLRSFRLAPEPEQGGAASAARLPELWAATAALAGTPGAAYLAGRGIPLDVAAACGARFSGDWLGAAAVVFPLHDRAGALVAANARYLSARAQPKTRTVGDLLLGAFGTPGAWTHDPLVLVEGPLDALALHAVGLPAVALGRTGPPAWLSQMTFGRRVAVALDADLEGDKAAAREIDRLGRLGALAFRWRPPERPGVKDFGDLAKPQNGGLAAGLWPVVAAFLRSGDAVGAPLPIPAGRWSDPRLQPSRPAERDAVLAMAERLDWPRVRTITGQHLGPGEADWRRVVESPRLQEPVRGLLLGGLKGALTRRLAGVPRGVWWSEWVADGPPAGDDQDKPAAGQAVLPA